MAEYPVPQGREMSQLRQEAIRRAREMQARAQIPINRHPPQPAPEPPSPPEPAPEHPPQEPASEPRQEIPQQPQNFPQQNVPQQPNMQQNMPHPRMQQMPMRPRQNSGQNRRPDPPATQPLGGALDFLTKDPERAMILILLLILMEEKADNSLLFAMMYLLA
jgi:hypothetical protein